MRTNVTAPVSPLLSVTRTCASGASSAQIHYPRLPMTSLLFLLLLSRSPSPNLRRSRWGRRTGLVDKIPHEKRICNQRWDKKVMAMALWTLVDKDNEKFQSHITSVITRLGKSRTCTRLCVEWACSMRKVQGSSPRGGTKYFAYLSL